MDSRGELGKWKMEKNVLGRDKKSGGKFVGIREREDVERRFSEKGFELSVGTDWYVCMVGFANFFKVSHSCGFSSRVCRRVDVRR